VRRLLGYAAVVMATLFGAYLLFEFRQVLLLFFMALILAATVRPAYHRLLAAGVKAPIALPLVYAGLVLLLGGLLVVAGPPLVRDLQALASTLAKGYEAAYIEWSEGVQAQPLLTGWLPAPDVVLATVAGTERGGLVARLATVTGGVLGFAGVVGAIFLISIYWTADSSHFERLSLALLPANRRAMAREIWRSTENELGAYIRSEALQSGAAAVLLGLGYWLLGLPYVALLALLGALAWLIPLAGPVFVLIPAVLVGLSSGGWLTAAAAATHAVLVMLLLEYVIEPRLFARRAYSPVVPLVLILALIQEYGLLGLVIGPPLAAALQRLFVNLLLRRNRLVVRAKMANEQLGELKERLALASATIDENGEDGAGPRYANLARRLGDLIRQTEETLAGQLPAGS
jgi:putative permease